MSAVLYTFIKHTKYRISLRYCSNSALNNLNLDQQIYTLVRQRVNPNEIIQLFNQNKDTCDYNAKTYLIVQKAVIKQKCHNRQSYAANITWENMKHKDNLNTKDYYDLISTFKLSRLPKTALKIFYKMIKDNIPATEAIYFVVMSCISQLNTQHKIKDAQKIYNIIINKDPKLLETNYKIPTSILNMFIKCGDMEHAKEIFQTKCDKTSVSTWCVFIDGMIEDNQHIEAINLFHAMINNGISPDCFAYTIITKGIRRLKALDKANWIYDMIKQDENVNINNDIPLCNSLITMFGACGDVNKSNEIWYNLINNKLNIADNKTLQAIIIANYDSGNYYNVIEIYVTMKQFRDNMPVINDQLKGSYRNMNPQRLTCIRSIQACGELNDVESGKVVHLDMIKNNVQLLRKYEVVSVLMDMYIKCCGVRDGIDLFKEVSDHDVCDVKMFMFMINCCIKYGYNMKAFELFDEMRNDYDIKPNVEVIVCILKICNQDILLKQMYEYINSIDSKLCDDPVVCDALTIAYNKCKDNKDI
eukprot:359718_1